MTLPRLFSLVLALGLFVAVPVIAEDSTSSGSNDALRTALKTKRDATATALKDYKDAKEAQKLNKLIAFGDKSVDERADAITEQEKQLTSKGCSAVALTAIKAAFTTVSTTLSTQRIAVDAAKTTDELKTTIPTIFQTNRVYMFLIPASRGVCLSQKLLDLISGKLASAVTKLKAAGIDTTAIDAKLATAKTGAQSAYDSYLAVVKNPGGDDTGNQAKMATAKTSLQSVRTILGEVKSDIGLLIENYKQATSTTGSPTSSTKTTTP